MPLFVPSSPSFPADGSNGDTHQSSPPSTQPHASFAASTAHVAHLADVLAAITAVHRHALMIVSQNGVTFYSEYNHIINCHVTIDLSMFSAFRYVADAGAHTEIGIDAQLMSDSFSAAAAAVPVRKGGDGVTCYLRYNGEGSPLIVEFEDRLMNEMIEFSTFYLELEYPYGQESSDEDRGLILDHAALHFEVIMKSDILVNLLQDLQTLDTQDLYMLISNADENNAVDFVSKGTIGYSKLEYPRARTVLQKLEVYEDAGGESVPTQKTILCVLAFAPFIRIFRAVKLSSKCKIMEDFAGVLSIQLLCKNVASANNPGTLITFNMLEKTDLGDGAVPTMTELRTLFDEAGYRTDQVSYQKFQASEPKTLENPSSHSVQSIELPFFL